MRVCVVCTGNICRSPMAEAVFRRRLADAGLDREVTVSSAGTGRWHVGDPPDPRALAALRSRGYDGSAHQAQQFRASWLPDLDLVLVMDRANAADLRRLAPDDAARQKIVMLRSFASADERSAEPLEVPDPYYGDDGGFDHVLDLIEEAADGFVAQVRRRVADPSHDVPR